MRPTLRPHAADPGYLNRSPALTSSDASMVAPLIGVLGNVGLIGLGHIEVRGEVPDYYAFRSEMQGNLRKCSALGAGANRRV